MSNDTNQVSFVASIARVQTLADGGIRVVLDLDEHAVLVAAWLMSVRVSDSAVDVMVSEHVQKQRIG